jgi:putative ABC transport system permease protein
MSSRAQLHAIALAWHHLAFHKVRSLIIVLALAISLALPAVMDSLMTRGEEATMARAAQTPWLLGAPGGGVDLVLGALWFLPEPLESIPMSEADQINESALATAIPLSMTATASGHAVIGTDIEYLRFRGLEAAAGRTFAMPGECILGANVAKSHGLQPGGTILTDPDGLFDIGRGYPLRLRITGVLATSESPDDDAVFCDLRTSWIIAGHGHAHLEVATSNNPNVVMGTNEGRVVASAAVTPYTELTPEHLHSLHFHGDPGSLPLEAIILVPGNDKNGTILAARLDQEKHLKLVSPSKIVREILDQVFKVGALLAGVLTATGIATLAVVVLVLVLSIRLRHDELETLQRIGASRSATATLLLSEVVLLALFAVAMAFFALWASMALPADLVLRLAG